jgi:hypothetical protein
MRSVAASNDSKCLIVKFKKLNRRAGSESYAPVTPNEQQQLVV